MNEFIEVLNCTVSVSFEYGVAYLQLDDDTYRAERSMGALMNKDQVKELINRLSELHDQMPENDL